MTQSVDLDLWLSILKIVEPKLERGLFITWFKDTTVLGKEDRTLIIGLPLPMFLNWHLERYRALTLEAAQSLDPTIETIVYNVDVSLKDDEGRTLDLLEHFPEAKKRKLPRKSEVKLAEGLTSKIFDARYTLENFVVGNNNRLAHAACSAVAAQPGGKYNPLFLYGGVGLGKTHLLQAVGNALMRQMPHAAILYTTSEDFTNEVVEAIKHQKMEQIRRRYRQVDALIIDDVQFLANKDRTQEEFFHTFNTLYDAHKQIIISSDRPPEKLMGLEDRIVSRFERGMIADIGVPDYETRLAILSEKAREYELFIDAKVLAFIAEHATKNVRELEGILMQAVAQYDLEHRMPTVKSIADIMTKLHKDTEEAEAPVGFDIPPERKRTLQDILEGVSRYYSISVTDILSESRVREILLPRQIAMFMTKKYLNMSYVRIGENFSHRDHTTVMHAVEKIEKKVQEDHQLLREIHAIERDIGLMANK
jgi:chromosomal replication initiator protein